MVEHRTEHIAMQQMNMAGTNGKIVGANWAYAWVEGQRLEEMERVVWHQASQTWRKWDMARNDWALLNGKNQIWDGVNFVNSL